MAVRAAAFVFKMMVDRPNDVLRLRFVPADKQWSGFYEDLDTSCRHQQVGGLVGKPGARIACFQCIKITC
jgi:hypothetical protein